MILIGSSFREVVAQLARKLCALVGLGAIFVTVSEFWFYPIDEEVSHIGILLAYSLLGYLFLLTLHYFRVTEFAGLYLAACLFGFLVEGAIVWYLYTELPVSIVWTSMAWHALITVCLGWYLVLRISKARWLWQSVYFAALGAGLGAWTTFMWYVDEAPDGDISWSWTEPTGFIEQFLLGFFFFVAGHVLYSLARPGTLRFVRLDYGLAIGALAAWTSLTLLVAFPASLLFLPLVAACLTPLFKSRPSRTPPASILKSLDEAPLGWRSYLAMIPLPICAIATHTALVEAQLGLEWNAILIVTAGPYSVWLFVRAFWRSWSRP